MILENHTRYRTADLERVILGALNAAGIERHGRDRVVVTYTRGGGFTGEAWKGKVTRWNGHPRMRLRLPEVGEFETVDFPQLVWLVRHEVAHWQGLDHSQMAPSLLYWYRHERRRISSTTPVGSELPLPDWAAGLEVELEDEEPVHPTKPRPVADDRREQKLAHARAMLARAERKAKLAATIEKRWRRRLQAAERAVAVAAKKKETP